MAVDVEGEYFYNGFPFLTKDFTISEDVGLIITNVVMKLMTPHFQKRIQDHTSLNLNYQLAIQFCSLLETIRQN